MQLSHGDSDDLCTSRTEIIPLQRRTAIMHLTLPHGARNIVTTLKMVYTYVYSVEYYSAIKNNAICSNMDRPRDYHTR